jgi:uncharacterized surface protein with fasciclin (FAS1) repeats
MKLLIYVAGTLILLSLSSCEKRWEDHYDQRPETVDMNVWEALQQDPELSLFVQYVKEFSYDTLFQTTDVFTLFVPDNTAMNTLNENGSVTTRLLDYHISRHYIQSQNIKGKKKIQTLAEKFALFENTGRTVHFDEAEAQFESPLYQNGKYFVLDEVAMPRPNLYEYYELENPLLIDYIDSHDSIILDRELSRPIGFDENGNTVYDTVSEVFNEFEHEFFPVSEESRNKTATFVFPREEDYNAALTEMALFFGGDYQDYSDIPIDWQYEVLVPYLLEHGVFENLIEPSEFIPPPFPDTLKMKNILGDSIYVEYEPVDQALCSNGYAYNYNDFQIPDTLYKSAQRTEGESLLEQIGTTRFAWNEDVSVSSSVSFEPLREYAASASNDSVLRVPFLRGYNQDFELEFNIEALFPGKYQMIVRTQMYVGGIYDIYVNDELVLSIDYYHYAINWEMWRSVTGEWFLPEGPYNRFDCWVDKKNEYGNTKVKFVYREPGNVQNNGLVIDYIDFVPFDD